jgi:hypothetical protein
MFIRATRHPSKLRFALAGPSGSGKTYSALAIATALGPKVALIDTEYGSSALYADRFVFDRCVLETFSPEAYVAAIHTAEQAGYDVIIVDSLSHAWMGRGGTLEQVDAATASGKNSHLAWREVTPSHNALVDALMRSPANIIATLRAKTEDVLDKDDKGKVIVRRIGLSSVQREGLEYEFDLGGELDMEHRLTLSKSRAPELAGKVFANPGAELAAALKAWLQTGAPAAVAPKAPPAAPAASPPGPPASTAREQVRAGIRAAKTKEQLEALVPTIQKLSESDRKVVRPEYGRRKNELAKALRAAAPRR